ncbi:MAG TPA: alpha/beta fold hydrolase [Ktedonobacterales bacterium]|nr:alpha/beta fold hydrolase [Ktedonobacterales bacterium]
MSANPTSFVPTPQETSAPPARRASAVDALAMSRPRWLDERLYPFTSHFIELEGNQIHYVDEGSGPVLLFLHANVLWSFQYRNIIKVLRNGFRCIALDYPGFGLSVPAPGYRNTLLGNSRLVERFIEALGLSDITLIAHDESVAIGLGVVGRHESWFRGLVLSNSFAWPLEEYPTIYRFIRVVSSPASRFLIVNFNVVAKYTVRSIAGGKLSRAERRAYLGPFTNRARRHHQHDLFQTLTRSHDYLADLNERMLSLGHMPALLLFADGDPTYKAGWLDRFERIFPRHRSVIIQGADHFPQEHDPEQMAATIREWWDDDVRNATRRA